MGDPTPLQSTHPLRKSSLSRDALQRAGLISQLPSLLAEFGVSLDQLDAIYPVPRSVWTDPNCFIPYSQFCGVLDAAARLTDCSHFGLLLGAKGDHSGLGVAGAWVFCAPTHRDAINGFIALQSSNTRAASIYIQDYGDEAFIGYGIYDRATVGREQAYALVTALAVRMGTLLTAGRSVPREVQFPFRPPKNVAPFERVFRAPVRFNSTACGVVLPKTSLDLTIRKHSPGDFEDWLRRAHASTPPAEKEWTSRIRHILRPLLARHRAVAPMMADLCGVPIRTLNRKLAAEGSSLRELVDDMRLVMAEEYLLLTDLSVGEISMLVGFEAEKSFYRSFKRWTGTTPEAWRSAAK
jgi:AraC-like DNA-binding protein